jgi:hypothetical protein
MTDKEALKLALEALEGVLDDSHKVLEASISGGLYEVVQCRDAITAIKQALAASVQKGAIGAAYQKSPWDGKGISMPPPAAPVQVFDHVTAARQGLRDAQNRSRQLSNLINCGTCGYPLAPEERTSLIERDGVMVKPAPVQEPVAGQPLPCPFCGHIGLDFSDGETYRWGVASCGGCGASCGDVRREYPDQGEWHTEAIAEWNRRSPAAPDLQAELDATNRQVEILSDALAESRREVDALVALARADERDKWMERAHIMILGEREACAKVCDELHWPWHMGDNSGPKECAAAIRARGNT